MKNKWMPITAGILDIGYGVVGTLGGLLMLIFGYLLYVSTHADYEIWGPIYIITGVAAIVGGIYSVKRKIWGLALTGAISACLIPTVELISNIVYESDLHNYFYWELQDMIPIVPAIFAIILTILSRKHF